MLKKIFFASTFVALAILPQSVQAGGVAVGSSSLIQTLDYSDTFTTAENGGNTSRLDNVVPYDEASALLEDSYGNPTTSWNYVPDFLPGFGNVVTDNTAIALSGFLDYPGPSGVGSDTGVAQKGVGPWYDFGMSYDLRTNFTVQYDTAWQTDRVNISIGNEVGTLFCDHSLNIFFRYDTSYTDVGYSPVGLFNPTIGEVDTGILPGITAWDLGWHNYAANFDLDNGLIDLYVDEVWKGQIDLNTIADGAFLAVIDDSTNDYVNLGGYYYPTPDDETMITERIFWTDNFQVGSQDASPEKIPGDANNDKKVDGSDVTILANNWQYGVGMTNPDGTWEMGDFNDDGMVDGSDVTILANNWQYGVTSAAATVPEPSTIVILASVLFSVLIWRRRK